MYSSSCVMNSVVYTVYLDWFGVMWVYYYYRDYVAPDAIRIELGAELQEYLDS